MAKAQPRRLGRGVAGAIRARAEIARGPRGHALSRRSRRKRPGMQRKARSGGLVVVGGTGWHRGCRVGGLRNGRSERGGGGGGAPFQRAGRE